MREAAALFFQTRIEKLKDDAPTDYSELEVFMKWLSIAWVFRNGALYKVVTHVIATQADERFGDSIREGILIPGLVMSEYSLCLRMHDESYFFIY